MSLRLEVAAGSTAPVERVWTTLIDWPGQRRWIPFTTVAVDTEHATGIGVHCAALSGFWLGRIPVGLLDRFVVTGWTEPTREPGELEILHLGPYFTGPGTFRVSRRADGGTDIACTELVDLPGAPLTEAAARLTLPLLKRGFALSLGRLAAIAEGR